MARTKALGLLLVAALAGSLLSRLPIGQRAHDRNRPRPGQPVVPTPEATPADFPLSAPGPYEVGVRPLAATDPTRGNRPVDVLV